MSMKIVETVFDKCYLIEPSSRNDNRGSMQVLYDDKEMRELLGGFEISEQRIYKMPEKHTFFGIHYLKSGKGKLISLIEGRGLDYIIDLRPDSDTYKEVRTIELDEDNMNIVYIPAGFGHAFISTTDNTVQSFVVDCGSQKAEQGFLNYKDPDIGLKLPVEDIIISDYDKNAPFLYE